MKNEFDKYCSVIDGIKFTSGKEALKILETGGVLVDLRDNMLKNGRNFRIKECIFLPFCDLEEKYSILPKDRFLIIADYVGLKSKLAVEFLKTKGYENLASLAGGILDWELDGMPMTKNENEELVGGCACQLRPRNPLMKNILFVCIHNSARSQMAEALLNSLELKNIKAESAGLEEGKLNPIVVDAMKEIGIDISGNKSKTVKGFIDSGRHFDYVITVCDQASGERCPFFPGSAYKRLHWSFDDPSKLEGTYEDKLESIRKIRDEIGSRIYEFSKELKEE